MSGTNLIKILSETPILPEEEMELAASLLANGIPETASGTWTDYLGWIIFGAVVLLAVIVMLLILAGKYRREKDYMAAQGEMAPDYAANYEVEDDLEDPSHSPFAEVIIEDTMPLDPEDASHHVEAYDQSKGADPLQYSGGLAEKSQVSLFNEPDEVSSETSYDDTDHPNVVPLRSTPEEGAEVADEDQVHETPLFDQSSPQEQVGPRYAFAQEQDGSRAASYQNLPAGAEMSKGPKDTQQGPDNAPGRYDGKEGSQERGQRPYVAPFIREDIEGVERRQAERIDSLKDELIQQVKDIKSEQSARLDLVISAVDRKLDKLDYRHSSTLDKGGDMDRHMTSFNEHVDRISSSLEGQGQRIRAITQILETRFREVDRIYEEIKTVHTEIKSVRTDLGQTNQSVGTVREDMDDVKEHVGRLERAILDRAAQEGATSHKLTDVIRGTLPDGSYSFGAPLPNGETADCLIRFDGLREKIAIDAGFPMEAFNELPSRDAVLKNLPQAKSAEDAFRRAILRSILEAADRCIAPEETADSCLLFLPSEAAYTILHDRFPDLVRDSQRARVWLVSPSTLMGTLSLIRNLLPDSGELEERTASAQALRAEDEQLRDEVESLKVRASRLADELERTRGTLKGLIGPADEGGTEDPQEDLSYADERGAETMTNDRQHPLENLKYEGTPDWDYFSSDEPSSSKQKSTSVFDDDRSDTLR